MKSQKSALTWIACGWAYYWGSPGGPGHNQYDLSRDQLYWELS